MTGNSLKIISRRAALSLTLSSTVFRSRLRAAGWRSEEVRRFAAPEANQAVAVDASHFYAIGNHVVAKYDKKTGKRLAAWEGEKARPLIHLNSGIVRNGILYCAHSNYPGIPMVSSIEMWNTKTMRRPAHLASAYLRDRRRGSISAAITPM